MKKFITILMAIILSLSLISCTTKTIFTKEFSYLPSQKEMILKNFEKPTKDKMGVATYMLNNKKAKDVLEDYEKQLVDDGWEITQDKKPVSITAEKGEHKTIIVPAQNEDDVMLTVVSK
jgi:flagellar basal body-associated protein FliL